MRLMLLAAALVTTALVVPVTGNPAAASTGDSYGSSQRLEIPAGRSGESGQSRRAVKAARKLFEQQDYAGTLEALGPALSRKDSADAYDLAARSHLALGNGNELVDSVRKGLALNGRHTGLRETAGEIFLALGELPQAQEQLAILEKACRGDCPERDRLASKLTQATATAQVPPSQN